jgi:quercetin dioxygenase-like cupin family protein
MPIISAADAPVFTPDELTTITGLAAPSRGATETSVWRVHLEPGAGTPPHTLTREEVFVALAGTATVTLADGTHEVGAGDALAVPADVEFWLANAGTEPFEAICAMPVGGRARVGDEEFPPPWSL